ncbi:MAG: hypothetical protein QGF33_01850 [Alphaproteobacteria bacterium]|nr:hypothetical protein [Alphaproteobacteria bacterium]
MVYLSGAAGDDTLTGTDGADSIPGNGGDGADSLFGNRGDDVLSGGADGDVFFVHARGGDDRIAVFTAGKDRIAVGGFTDQTPDQTPGQSPGLSADQWLATLTAEDTDAGLRLTDGDSLGLTIANHTRPTSRSPVKQPSLTQAPGAPNEARPLTRRVGRAGH